MSMLKKLSAIILALIMATMVTACGSSGETGENEDTAATESSEAMSGGWEIYDNEANVLPEDVQAAFDKAAETFVRADVVYPILIDVFRPCIPQAVLHKDIMEIVLHMDRQQ